MRFLGKRIRTDFSGEVVSRFRDRPEGLRIKHALDLNSVKLYDKQGSVLRVELCSALLTANSLSLDKLHAAAA